MQHGVVAVDEKNINDNYIVKLRIVSIEQFKLKPLWG